MMKSPPLASYRKFPRRTATYVTIDQLVNRQYNFDLQKLSEELIKLRSESIHNASSGADTQKQEDASIPAPKSEPSAIPSSTSQATAALANLAIDQQTKPTPPPNAWNQPLTALPSTSAWQPASQALPPQSKFHIRDPPRDGFNLCVLVGKVEVVVDKFRVDGTRVLVAEVQVGDNTGSISLRARDEQIDMLKRVSKERGAVVLRNCTMELHQRKYLRLAVSKWGKMMAYPDGISSTPDPPLSMNEDKNFSLVDLNLVATAKENILPNQPSASHQHSKFDSKQHHKHQHQQGRNQHFEGRRNSGYHQRNPNRKYQSPRRQPQQQSMYSPPRGYYDYQHHHQGAQAPVFYPSYTGGDASSAYSYQSHSTERSSPPSHGQQWSHHAPYSNEYDQRQQQQLMYQQYELQQRHAHQMQMLQETQRRLMAVEHQRMGGGSQGIHMVESHENNNDDYSIPSTIAMAPPLSRGSFSSPNASHPASMGYRYSPPVSSPMRSMLRPGEAGRLQDENGHQGQQVSEVPAANVSVVSSPPVSPQWFDGRPPSGYGDPLLYFDQSSIPLTGMQEQDPSANNDEE